MGRSDLKGKSIPATVHWGRNSHPWNKAGGKLPKGGKKKVVYQEHHPDKRLYPDWTIRLRRNHHLFFWRQVQGLSINGETLRDLVNLKDALAYEISRRENIITSLMKNEQSNQG